MTAAEALRACGLLSGFTDTGIQILASICTARSYPAGTLLFAEAMVSDSMLVIGEGRVALSTKGERGDLPLGELSTGDWLGELSLINPGQRMCTATAVTTVTAVEIRQAEFQKLVATKPQACMKLLMAICTQFGAKVAANRDALRSLVARS
ncbi:MAG: cyclic nucleotide-binding domain-containing protein [Archangium gephyra]|uniref:Cyclic nucleotide-binding domain-containing protein n=1 Tax=Archangium gephyra TaxID=48 RepID=A0A2W5TL21_9BACT|nr:MAG: cyclic nucleotide-binding domain-containing protein [Archangium gephyra]